MKKAWVILGTIFIIITILVIIDILSPTQEEKRLQAEKARAEQERIYNEEHKEEHYQKGLELLNEADKQETITLKISKLEEALKMFKKVSSVDEGYKDIQAQIQNTNDLLVNLKKQKEIADAKQMIVQAKKLSKSNRCYELSQAIEKCKRALKILPDSKEAKKYLFEAQINKLRCYEGNSELEMAIEILDYRPLKLYVWIKNKSNTVRHANPNYFTLVTIRNRSLSVSTDTYGLSNYFDAVELQPGTETSGVLIFDTWDKPKKLVYSEMLGTTISREFPFPAY